MDGKKPGVGRGFLLRKFQESQQASNVGQQRPSASADVAQEPSAESSGAQASPGLDVTVMTTTSADTSSTPSIVDTPSKSSESSAPPAPVPKGRGFLLTKPRETAVGASTSAPSQQPSQGRASLLKGLQESKHEQLPGPQVEARKEPPQPPADPTAEIVRKTETMSVQSMSIVSRQGETGRPVSMSANYLDLTIKEGFGIFVYEVKYLPDIDSSSFRRKLLNQHLDVIGEGRMFDGCLLHVPQLLKCDKITLESVHPMDNSKVTLTLTFKKKESMANSINFFNKLIGRIMRGLNLSRIGRQDFNSKAAKAIPQHHVELWPGYVTAVNECEGGVKLCLDATHRVMRTDTVRDILIQITQKNSRDYKSAFARELIGTTVLTRYNNKTYRIDDIMWDDTPMFQFDKKGEKVSLFDYYKMHWNMVIRDLEQPLLLSRNKERTQDGQERETKTVLVPELCHLAGLTDRMRKDFRIMTDLAKETKMSPARRHEVICTFVKQVNSNEVTRKVLTDWGLALPDDTVRFKGRVIEPETLVFGSGQELLRSTDWSRSAVNNAVIQAAKISKWVILYTQQDARSAKDFSQAMGQVSRKMGIQVDQPSMVQIRDDQTITIVRELRSQIENNPDIVVVILPSNKNDRYAAIKKLCCVQSPIPSQVIIGKTISKPDKLKSVTEKICLQMNCKLGGALWAAKVPFDHVMICGIDVFHAGPGQASKGSIAAFIASMNRPLTKWYSKICIQQPHQELIDLLRAQLAASLANYHRLNGRYPERIVIYRDGVGDGALEVVRDYEIKQLMRALTEIQPQPKMTMIIVQKRINTRLFLINNGKFDNPPPGAVVDSEVTRPYLYDFYLIPQAVKSGTVSPTHYIVLHDEAMFKTDHLQKLTYKLCHLYYNWPGTIRVPAPVQYAHKLAYLVGQSIQAAPSSVLDDRLYYL